MLGLIKGYTNWLHTQWPAGTVEKLPEVREDGSTAVPGVLVVGDLTGIPLLKFSADTGAKAAQRVIAELKGESPTEGVHQLIIIGGGVSGMAAALEAEAAGLDYVLLEASEPFSTIKNFPKAKPIYTYPTEMVPAGQLQFSEQVKEPLVDEIERQTSAVRWKVGRAERVHRTGGLLEVPIGGETLRAQRVIIAIGRSGNYRKLGVEGEELDKVSNRLHDPQDYAGKQVLVVGGGDSALEGAIALAQAGASVTLSYRKDELTRPKPDNVEALMALAANPDAPVGVPQPTSPRQTTATGAWVKEHMTKRRVDRSAGKLTLALGTQVTAISDSQVTLKGKDGEQALPNDVVFSMIGREAPLDFFRRSGIPIRGERGARWWITLLISLAICTFIYHWKKSGTPLPINEAWQTRGWFPFNLKGGDGKTLIGATLNAAKDPGFYYSLAYCLCVVIFGFRRIQRRNTPYITRQTLTLMAFQVIPLFLLPYMLLPWLGNNGVFANGTTLGAGADWLFEAYDSTGHNRAWWRAFGLILAWPLFVFNVFTEKPMWGWLIVSLIQTFVIIPLLIRKWGKGAYCGWICSCGALAETLGDAHREKMPHGPGWNRLNMAGQVILWIAFALLGWRIVGWMLPPEHVVNTSFKTALFGAKGHWLLSWFNYAYAVDLILAGIVGVALYFHFSGRMWCRFFCPLAALMHIYARFSRFRIIPEKKKCISCNVCTSVCHQGIDIMNFANKGIPMSDPQCVRCSACVQSCPTGVLQFGEVDADDNPVRYDSLPASPVLMREAANSQ